MANLYLKKMKEAKFIYLYTALMFFLILSCIIFTVMLNQNGIYKGIKIDSIDVSNLSKSDAVKKLDSKFEASYLNKDLKYDLVYNGKSWPIYIKDLKPVLQTEKAVETAYEIGRKGNIFIRFYDIMFTRFLGRNLNISLTIDESKLKKKLDVIAKDINIQEKDAKLNFKDGKIFVIKESNGLELDIQKNLKLLENQLTTKNNHTINLVVNVTKPRVFSNNLAGLDTKLASFSTVFNPGDVNRTENIRVACSRLNGKVLLPGDVFSMNECIGARTLENGYKEATVIYKNELIKGPGGGVCQVTTTLYDTVLKAMLKVVERRNHTLPLTYVLPGADATLADQLIDFKFKNTYDQPIAIRAEVSGNKINISLYGVKKNNDYVVKIKSQVIKRTDPEQAEIKIDNTLDDDVQICEKEPKQGLTAAVYREIYQPDGKLVKIEKISQDEYKPVRAVVRMNEITMNKVNNGSLILNLTKDSQ